MIVGPESNEAFQLVVGEVARAPRPQRTVETPGAHGRRLRAHRAAAGLWSLRHRRRRGRCVLGEPLPEEGEGEPVHVRIIGRDPLATGRGEREAEQARFGLHPALLELVHFVLDELKDGLRDRVSQLAGPRRPLPDDVDEGFGEDDLGAGQEAQLEVAGRVFGDLLPETALELEEVVVDAGADYVEGVVEVRECEEGFALDVGFGDVEGVERRGVVVEDTEEVIVVADGVAGDAVVVVRLAGFGDVRG